MHPAPTLPQVTSLPAASDSHRLPAIHAGLAVAVLLIGCGLAGHLVMIKLRLLYDPDFVSSCNLGQSLDCDAVQTSPYSSVFGIPLALLGLATYVYLLVLVTLAATARRLGQSFLVLLAASGIVICAHSLYLAFVSSLVIRAYCLYCIGMYGVNLIVTGLSLHAIHHLRRRSPRLVPGFRSLLQAATVGAGVYALSLALAVPSFGALRADFKARRIEEVRAELSKFVSARGRSYYEVPITEQDFVLGPADAAVTLVEFGDFECPFCFAFYERSKPLRQKYADSVRWVFKHFPQNSECNERARGEYHPDSCNAARAANCAGEQSRFWPMHDQLFENRYELGEADLRRHAEHVGVDLAKWDACFARTEPDPLIAAHVVQARTAKIVRTPTSYINGFLVAGVVSRDVLETYFQAALEQPWDPAPEIAALAPAALMIELKLDDRTFYIDGYEASRDSSGAARSQPGVRPMSASWMQARRACRAAGKRLCSAEEWTTACAGAASAASEAKGLGPRPFPYGFFYQPGVCHDGRPAGPGKVKETGSFPRCRTPEGAYDLAGNLAEWTGLRVDTAAVMGSHIGSGAKATCLSTPTRRGNPGLRSPLTGFRCCADRAVGARGPGSSARR